MPEDSPARLSRLVLSRRDGQRIHYQLPDETEYELEIQLDKCGRVRVVHHQLPDSVRVLRSELRAGQ